VIIIDKLKDSLMFIWHIFSKLLLATVQ